MHSVIAADTSSLILYTTIGQLYILQNTFPKLIVTDKVASEYGVIPDWISILQYTDFEKFNELSNALGKGEASAICLSLEHSNSILLMDEKKGRRIARDLGIPLVGSIGTLLLAKQKGVINSVREIIDSIKVTNFRISDEIVAQVLAEAGE